MQNNAVVQTTGSGTVTLNGIAPAAAGNRGVLITSGGKVTAGGGNTNQNLGLKAGSVVAVAFTPQNISASGYEFVHVDGTVDLGGATLQTSSSGSIPANAAFTLVQNNGGSATNGTFANLPEGTQVNVGGVQLPITYVGFDGNDVVLQTVQATQAPTITTQPNSQTVTTGNSVTFTAAASGVPLPTVQWQVSTNGGLIQHYQRRYLDDVHHRQRHHGAERQPVRGRLHQQRR